MRTIANNFKGSGVFEYKIVLITHCEYMVSVEMHIKTPFVDDYMFYDLCTGTFKPEQGESSAVGFEKALKAAEKKWNLKLIKADLQVA